MSGHLLFLSTEICLCRLSTPDRLIHWSRYYSNRSAAYASKGRGAGGLKSDFQSAVDDACRCINLKPGWARGYSRKGAALCFQGRHKEAIECYEEGLQMAPSDQALIAAKKSAHAATTSKGSVATGGSTGAAPQVDKKRLMVVVAIAMALGQAIYHVTQQGAPMLYTMALLFASVQLKWVPVTRQ